jgi:dTDP-glucose 4,6-dehydratase
MKVLVTGGAGFIGSNFIRYLLTKHPDWDVTNLDKLTYAGNLENLDEVRDKPAYHFIKGDIVDGELVDKILIGGFDAVLNFAAESHVDRSILDASPFLDTNIKGTLVILDRIKKFQIKKYIQVSTDEVYGSIEKGSFIETSPLSPGNPYAACKAAADLLCLSYWKTQGIPVVITRCANNYGPYQFPEKLIPLAITNIIENKPVPIYGDGLNIRNWIYVIDHCIALESVLLKGKPGEIYNIASNQEKTNLEIVDNLLKIMGKSKELITFVPDRPGHDRRYSMKTRKIMHEIGWRSAHSFEESLEYTVQWYLNNDSWWRHIKSGEYANYYQKMYCKR